MARSGDAPGLAPMWCSCFVSGSLLSLIALRSQLHLRSEQGTKSVFNESHVDHPAQTFWENPNATYYFIAMLILGTGSPSTKSDEKELCYYHFTEYPRFPGQSQISNFFSVCPDFQNLQSVLIGSLPCSDLCCPSSSPRQPGVLLAHPWGLL